MLEILARELPAHDRHLLARALVAHHQLEALRDDRQVVHAPALVFRVVLVRFGQLHEVAHSPRDHMLGTLQKALLLLEGALEHAREVLPHGGLLCDHKRL